MRIIKILLCIFATVAAYLSWHWSNLDNPQSGQIVAYRAGGQLLDYERPSELENCAAKLLLPSDNIHIENSLQSLHLAANSGVDIFHLNVWRIADNQFVVFHDFTLDCATNGSGRIAEKQLPEVLSLDVGYGYTFDEGKSFPFRGKGYKIPLLIDVLDAYPEKEFWLNLKNDSKSSFRALNALLSDKYADRMDSLVLISSDKVAAYSEVARPGITVISYESTKKCVLEYLFYGWSGLFPESCSRRPVLLPPSMVKYIWGYPEKFAAKAQRNGSRVFLWERHSPIAAERIDLNNGIGVVSGDLAGLQKIIRG